MDFPEPYARMPWGQKVSPHHSARRKSHFSVRMSIIFGADIHDPKGFRKTLLKKFVPADYWPLNIHETGNLQQLTCKMVPCLSLLFSLFPSFFLLSLSIIRIIHSLLILSLFSLYFLFILSLFSLHSLFIFSLFSLFFLFILSSFTLDPRKLHSPV